MSKRTRRYLMIALLYFLIIAAMLEVLLRITDPLGLKVDFDKAYVTHELLTDDPRGYSYKQGTWHLSNWTATIDDTQNRVVPDSVTDGHTVVFVGDSLTFGAGVDDQDTFVNLVASGSRINAINRAISGYNIQNVRRSIELETCSCPIVYLILPNDADHEHVLSEYRNSYAYPTSMLSMYLRPNPRYEFFDLPLPDMTMFYSELDRIVQDRRVRLVAFDDAFAQDIQGRGYAMTILPRYEGRISHVDPHPDKRGHEEIAAAIAPYVDRWLSEVVVK